MLYVCVRRVWYVCVCVLDSPKYVKTLSYKISCEKVLKILG